MARCPKCQEHWFWDWEQDCYRYLNGSDVESTVLNCTEKGMELELVVFKCKCGKVNSTMYNDSYRGSSLCNIEEWKDIDWEQNKNSWIDCYSTCDDKICLED